MPLALTISQDTKPPEVRAPIDSNAIEYELHRAYINPLLEKNNSGKGGITYEDLMASWDSVKNCASKLGASDAGGRANSILETVKVSTEALSPFSLFYWD